MHTSVLLNQSIESLNIKSNGIYIDATFGRGGHSLKILEKLDENGKLFAIDQDPEAIEYANNHPIFSKDKRFKILPANFSELKNLCEQHDLIKKVDGILFDFGVSSPQLDQATRGFSFLKDGPLDMRMDPTAGISCADFIKELSESELADILVDYGEEKFAKKIARNIKERLKSEDITNTLTLAKIIENSIPRKFHEKHKHPATRSFQALRIAVNKELDVINDVILQLKDIMKAEGRVSFITFHSLEDRIIKQFIKKNLYSSSYDLQNIPKNLPIKDSDINKIQNWKWIIKKQKADQLECEDNIRSRSATLRVIERVI